MNRCIFCGEILEKDIIALNKKLRGANIKKMICVPCLADYLGCEIDDLMIKIQEYKEQGCTLFK